MSDGERAASAGERLASGGEPFASARGRAASPGGEAASPSGAAASFGGSLASVAVRGPSPSARAASATIESAPDDGGCRSVASTRASAAVSSAPVGAHAASSAARQTRCVRVGVLRISVSFGSKAVFRQRDRSPGLFMASPAAPPRRTTRRPLRFFSFFFGGTEFGTGRAANATSPTRTVNGRTRRPHRVSPRSSSTCAADTRGASGGTSNTHTSPAWTIPIRGWRARRISSETACPSRRERERA